jgi:hypothetical protein
MAHSEADHSTLSTDRVASKRRNTTAIFVRLPTFWKAMIVTSFVINIVLITLLLFIAGFVWQWRAQLLSNTVLLQGFAHNNVVELRDVIDQLQAAHIKTNIPLDQPLDLNLIVPIDQTTLVTTTQDVPINVPASIDMGAFGHLNPNVSLNLPVGTPLLIRLKLDVPLHTQIPVKLKVPVDIAMADTELAPQFRRLGYLVDRLLAPVAPYLNLKVQQPSAVKPETPTPTK